MKKIFIITLILIIICIGTSCFAAINEDDFFNYIQMDKNEVYNFSQDDYYVERVNYLKNALKNYDNFYHYYVNGGHNFYITNGDFYYSSDIYGNIFATCTTGNNFVFISIDVDGTMYNKKSILQADESILSNNLVIQNHKNRNFLRGYYSDNTLTNYYNDTWAKPIDIFNVPEVVYPTISGLNTSYNENYYNIDFSVNCNNYYDAIVDNVPDVNFYLDLVTYDLQDNIISHTNLPNVENTGVFSDNYNSDTDSFDIRLNDYYKFSFNSSNKHKLFIREYQVDEPLYSSEYFTYSLLPNDNPLDDGQSEDDYNNNPNAAISHPPTIMLSTRESALSVVVTLVSRNGMSDYMYYSIDNGGWVPYTGPITITSNCYIYAKYVVDGVSSAIHSRIISNITSSEAYQDRPTVAPIFKGRVVIEDNTRYVTVLHTGYEKYDDYSIEWSTNKSIWNPYPGSGVKKNGAENYYEYPFDLPIVLYFRLKDSNGYYSPISFLSLNKNTNTPGTANTLTDSVYDDNGNYIVDSSHSTSSSVTFDSLGIVTTDTASFVSSGLSFAWDFVSQFSTFFVLIQSLWIFVPKIVMDVIIGLLFIRFIIAAIGFLRG